MAMAYSSGFNLTNLKQSLYRKQERVELGVRQAIEEGAELIMEEAKANVPVDTYNLEDAIHISNRRTRLGNHAIDIEVSGTGRDGRDVGEYAMIIHEMYDHYIQSGQWEMGEGTRAKQASDPTHHVGSKYMERAVAEKRREAVDKVRRAVREATR